MADAITAAAFLGLLATCGQPDASPTRMLAIGQHESGLRPTAIHDNVTDRSYFPDTPAEAIAVARSLLAKGHRIDAGLTQVTDANWRTLGLTIDTVFDPRANVCGGARILADAYRIERRTACRYNTGRPDCANGYPEAIDRAQVPAPLPTPVATRIGPCGPNPPTWDGWAMAKCLNQKDAKR